MKVGRVQVEDDYENVKRGMREKQNFSNSMN